MNQIEITATIAKTSIDAKKASITLEVGFDSWGQIPEIAKMAGAGQTVNVVLYPSQTSMEL